MSKSRTRADGFALQDLSAPDNGALTWNTTNSAWEANSNTFVIDSGTDVVTDVEIGSSNLTVARDATINFHTSITNNTYDSRIRAFGGATNDGEGQLAIDTLIFTVTSNINEFQSFSFDSAATTRIGTIGRIRSVTAATNAYNFLVMVSDYDGAPDVEFVFTGDGNGKCDGAWTGGGADYAEWFEWEDGNSDNEDRVGYSVALGKDGMIRLAVEEDENIIGVISGNPAFIGDGAELKWVDKYLKDDFGRYIEENGERVLNPIFAPKRKYIPRSKRQEWSCVGLTGKLRMRKGQPVDNFWIKLKDISDEVEEWLIR